MTGVDAPVLIADHAADRIRRRIEERMLKPGDFVGTEDKLAAELKMSRTAIRDALGRLRGLGLVNSRPRTGIVVAQTDPAEVLGLVIPQYAVDHATLAELAQLRYCQEIGALELAIKQLDGIGSSLTIPARGGRIMSLGDGLAKAMTKYLRAKGQRGLKSLLLGKVDLLSEQNRDTLSRGETTGHALAVPTGDTGSRLEHGLQDAFKIKCPCCQDVLLFREGCVECPSCGFSQC